MVKNKNKGKPRNYALASGVYRFGASKTFHKKAIYKFVKKTTAKKPVVKKPVFVEKKIGGDKNGGTRLVMSFVFFYVNFLLLGREYLTFS
jgi:large subunit ribosomal protein L6e